MAATTSAPAQRPQEARRAEDTVQMPYGSDRPWSRREPRKLNAVSIMVAVPEFAAQFKPVPEPYLKRGYTRDWIGCVCRRGHVISERHSFHHCACGRVFVATARNVYAAQL